MAIHIAAVYLQAFSNQSLIMTAIALIIVMMTRQWIGGRLNTWRRDLTGRVFVLTGFPEPQIVALIPSLVDAGCHVVLLVPKIDVQTLTLVHLLRSEANPNVWAELCDISSLTSVTQFCETWNDAKTPRRIDGLILGPLQVTTDVKVMLLNQHHLLTSLLPSIFSAPRERDIRIIQITTPTYIAGLSTYGKEVSAKLDAFQKQADLAIQSMILTRHLQREIESAMAMAPAPDEEEEKEVVSKLSKTNGSNVRVMCSCPGFTRSYALKQLLNSRWDLIIVAPLIRVFIYCFAKSEAQGAQSTLFCCFAPPSQSSLQSGGVYREYIDNRVRLPSTLSDLIDDEQLGAKLWKDLESELKIAQSAAKKLTAKN